MTRGRPPSQVTKLGRLIVARDTEAYKVAAACGFANRTLTEYLAGRRYIRADHARALADYFSVPIEDIVDEDITTDLTNNAGIPLNGVKSVRELPQRIRPPQPIPHPQTPSTAPRIPVRRSSQ